ncbi:hypothetical protein LOTGIDRAFT_118366 [Lottia gigantea]|uniref:Core Histone H2A/H2B/H3 domain-containing protein n=1 Tax=Lottia gigantea TaxID=225164 RepID=V4AH36_LOTGI|nr:hypothetical protein LOTGIDRAFT_118366 [Lottia gigantea]ESO94480.1 hypothetical protein LOTGIDRAFT_118366 [Lottia gigantea]
MKSTLVETQCQLFQSNYKTYIRRILKHVHKNMQISKDSLDQMNGFMNYLFHALAYDAAQRARRRRQKTLTGREVQDAIKSRFPGNIKIFAVLNGIETLDKFIRNN